MPNFSNEELSEISTKQKISAIKDISQNISTLNGVYRSLNSFKPGVLDEGADKEVAQMMMKTTTSILLLQERLEELEKLL